MTSQLESGASDSAGPAKRVVEDLAEIAGELRASRQLLYQLTLRDVKIRYKQAVMGFGWALLMPLLIVLSGSLIRLAIATVSDTAFNRAVIGGIAVKAIAWAFFASAVGFATSSLTSNMNLVTKVYFPREVLPLSTVLTQAVDAGIAAIALALVLPFLGASLSPALLWVPGLALLIFLCSTAAALLLSSANVFFRDVKYLVQVLLTFGIFFTPVFFEPAVLGPTGAWALMLNPLAPALEGLRLAVIEGHNLLTPLVTVTGTAEPTLTWSPWYLAYGASWAVGSVVVSAVVFHRAEFSFAEYV